MTISGKQKSQQVEEMVLKMSLLTLILYIGIKEDEVRGLHKMGERLGRQEKEKIGKISEIG